MVQRHRALSCIPTCLPAFPPSARALATLPQLLLDPALRAMSADATLVVCSSGHVAALFPHPVRILAAPPRLRLASLLFRSAPPLLSRTLAMLPVSARSSTTAGLRTCASSRPCESTFEAALIARSLRRKARSAGLPATVMPWTSTSRALRDLQLNFLPSTLLERVLLSTLFFACLVLRELIHHWLLVGLYLYDFPSVCSGLGFACVQL